MVSPRIENYSWGEYDFSTSGIEVLDTSLRDGLQDSRIKHPSLEEKIEFIEMLVESGIDAVDIAIPVARGPHLRDAIQLAKRLPTYISVACLARTHEVDIEAADALAQGAGRPIEGIIFVGSSPLRRFVQGWGIEEMAEWMAKNVTLAVEKGIIPIVATEHTTETEPDVIKLLYRVGLECGARRVCIADTTGAATEKGVRKLMKFFKEEILVGKYSDVPIDWHGHNDRDLAVANSLVALDAGAKRVHVSVLGIGERAGNTPLESMMLNLKIANDPKRQDLTKIVDLSQFSSKIFDVPITAYQPGIGEKVSETASGIHANAMMEAKRRGIEPGAPYSVVDPRWFGRESSVRVGPLSGVSNVEMVAEKLGLPVTPGLLVKVLDYAVTQNKLLTDQDIYHIARSLENGDKHTYS